MTDRNHQLDNPGSRRGLDAWHRFRQPVGVLLGLVLLFGAVADADARTRLFCKAEPFYAGQARACGGHLEPVCTSGADCDSGHNVYSGSPFPKTVNCPAPVKDERITAGCYDYRPTCADCGGSGQPPCPAAAEPWCTLGCDAGLTQNPLTTLCEVPSGGQYCGPGAGNACFPGYTCNELTASCVPKAEAGQSCANPFVGCADGLQCTLALECSHSPARRGETCDASAPCGPGLFCQAGVPQRCQPKRRVGEGCSAFNPCVDGASCEACLTENCRAPLQCFPDSSAGAITTQQCKTLYSPGDHAFARQQGQTFTYAAGNGISALVAESQAFGVAYGQDGRYGCFTSFCYGIEVDAAIEGFIASGYMRDFDAVGGKSYTNVQELQAPGSLVNVSFAQYYERFGSGVADLLTGDFIGWEWAYGPGLGANPSPFTSASYLCETVLDTVYSDDGGVIGIDPAPLAPVPGPAQPDADGFGALQFDGGAQRIGLADAAGLSVDDGLTVELWALPMSADGVQTLISKAGEYRIGMLDGELAVALGGVTSDWSTWLRTGVVLPAYRWSHVALVYDTAAGAPTLHVYLDGRVVLADTAVAAYADALPGDDTLVIGAGYTGRLDAIRIWSRALDRPALRETLSGDPPASDAALLAAWEFSEEAGDRLADSSRHGRDLSRGGFGAAPVFANGSRTVTGGALHFDGDDDFVGIDDDAVLASLELRDALTLEAWLYPTGPGSDPTFGGTIINKEGEYSLARKPNGQIIFALANTSPGWSSVDTAAFAPLHRWTHVALTYGAASGEIAVYVNGQPVDSQPGSGPIGDFHPDLEQLRIGGRQRDTETTSHQRFEGVIDEVRVWNATRSAGEIATTYDRAVPAGTEGLLAAWRFDEGPLALAFDTSGNAHHGHLGPDRPWAAPRRVDAAGLPIYPAALLSTPGDDPLRAVMQAVRSLLLE
jgi:hypothetical protein